VVSESKGHRSELEALKEQDPEFYKYLLETDKDLLEFEADGSDSEGENEETLEVS
jgi:nucleolar complex protein 2